MQYNPTVISHFCPICGGRNISDVATLDRYKIKVNLSCCQKCGLVFLNPKLTQDEYLDFYFNSGYRKLIKQYKNLIGRPVVEVENDKQYFKNVIKGLKFNRMLDIGGTTGKVDGKVCISVNPAGCDMLGENQIVEQFERASIDGSFDLILMCRTVEHLYDLPVCFKKAYLHLTYNGIFFVDFVNFDVDATIKIDHLYYFTRQSMTKLLQSSGFEIIKEFKSFVRHISYFCKKGIKLY